MPPTQIVPGVYAISLGFVNAFLIDDAELTLIDTGVPGSAKKILAAVRELGRQPADIRQIVVTHCHPDHTGSLNELKQATGAAAAMHPLDAALVRDGVAGRPMQPAPGLLNTLIFRLMSARRAGQPAVEAAAAERELADGEVLPFASGLRVIHTPGHSAGHVSLLWPRHGGVLFAADACSNVFGLSYSPIYEDLAEGQRSLGRLASLDFAAACFGHGKAIVGEAAGHFQAKWGKIQARSSTA
jgi:glyoxylase-like metal-dependent hydrolase (beta-lactamase superfamily II)